MLEQRLSDAVLKKVTENIKCPQSALLREGKLLVEKKTDQLQEKALELYKKKILSISGAFFYPALFGYGACAVQTTCAFYMLSNLEQIKHRKIYKLNFYTPIEEGDKGHSMCLIQLESKSLSKESVPCKELSALRDYFQANFRGIILDSFFNFSGTPDKIPDEILNYIIEGGMNLFEPMDNFLGEIRLGPREIKFFYDQVEKVARETCSLEPKFDIVADFNLLKIDVDEKKINTRLNVDKELVNTKKLPVDEKKSTGVSVGIVKLVEQARAFAKKSEYQQAFQAFEQLLSTPSLSDNNRQKILVYYATAKLQAANKQDKVLIKGAIELLRSAVVIGDRNNIKMIKNKMDLCNKQLAKLGVTETTEVAVKRGLQA